MSDSRRVLVCPNCGAPLPPGAAHESVTCAFCGTASAVAALTAEASRSELVCPRCDERLFAGQASGVEMLGCGLCGGIWLDNASAQRVTQHFDEQVVALASRASENATRRVDVRAVARCGACRNEMQRRTFGPISIDYCAAHGTWFDAGELAALVAPMEPPAMQPSQSAPQAAPSWGNTAGDAVMSAAGSVAADVAANVAVGAFELLIGILTD